jgi:calmodulin
MSSERLQDSKLEEVQEVFGLFDIERKGVVSTAELGTILRTLGYTPNKAELAKMARKVDPDCQGQLELAELLKLIDGIRHS